MNKQELIKQISKNANINIEKSRTFLNAFIETTKECLAAKQDLNIKGWGKLYIKTKKATKHYNPFKKEVCELPQKNVIRFCSSSKLELNNTCDLGISVYPVSQSYNIIEGSILNSSKRFTTKDCKEHSSTSWKLQTNEGNKILPNKPNYGIRANSGTKEKNIFRHIGKVTHGAIDLDYFIPKNYPTYLIPQNGTEILGYNTFTGTTSGVMEPVLFHTLYSYFEKYSDFEILQNITIPIKNRNYGYKPDIALIWKEKNIFIDIEVDEPYDIVTRKPIHYIECSDELRNKYMQENGWFVLRFSEEQIVNDIESVKNTLIYLLSCYTKDMRFNIDFKPEFVSRWTYEQAHRMEEESIRENYLKIEKKQNSVEHSHSETDYAIPDSFEFLKPNTDILTYNNALKNSIIRHLDNNEYTVIKRAKDGYEFVIAKGSTTNFKWENNEYGLDFFDFVEETWYFVPLSQIDEVKSSKDICRKNKNIDFKMFVQECMINCHPINITYINKKGEKSSRKLLYLTPSYDAYDKNKNLYPHLDIISAFFPYIYETLSNKTRPLPYFSAYCLKRQELRTFNVQRITDGFYYDCYKPKTTFSTNSMWELLTENGAKYAETIYKNMSKTHKEDLINIGNYCNALVCNGNIDKAYNIVTKYPKKEILSNKNQYWYEIVYEDINFFIQNNIQKENFCRFKKKIKQWK